MNRIAQLIYEVNSYKQLISGFWKGFFGESCYQNLLSQFKGKVESLKEQFATLRAANCSFKVNKC